MGQCLEFGREIEPGCQHAMVADRRSCYCPECRVVCPGLFAGCADVWAAGPRTVSVAPPQVRSSRRQQSAPAAAAAASATAPATGQPPTGEVNGLTDRAAAAGRWRVRRRAVREQTRSAAMPPGPLEPPTGRRRREAPAPAATPERPRRRIVGASAAPPLGPAELNLLAPTAAAAGVAPPPEVEAPAPPPPPVAPAPTPEPVEPAPAPDAPTKGTEGKKRKGKAAKGAVVAGAAVTGTPGAASDDAAEGQAAATAAPATEDEEASRKGKVTIVPVPVAAAEPPTPPTSDIVPHALQVEHQAPLSTSEGPPPWRWVALGAAALLVIVSVAAVALTGGGDGGNDTATETRATAAPVTVESAELVWEPFEVAPGVTGQRVWTLEGDEGDRFEATLTLANTTDAPVTVSHQELIPKNLVKRVERIEFADPQPQVIEADPIVQWDVEVPAQSEVTVAFGIDVRPEGNDRARLREWATAMTAEAADRIGNAEPPPEEPPPPTSPPATSGGTSPPPATGGGPPGTVIIVTPIPTDPPPPPTDPPTTVPPTTAAP